MAFPETVDFALGANDPIPSALLMLLQQGFAGDLHTGRTLVLGAERWIAKPAVGRGAGGIPPAMVNDQAWAWGGTAPSIVACSISDFVPVGHEITSIVWSYSTGGGLVTDLTLAMWARDLNVAIAPVDVAPIGPYGSGFRNPWGTITDSPAYIMPAATAVSLEVNLRDAAHKFGGALVTYRKIP